jgi:hypothetical protein
MDEEYLGLELMGLYRRLRETSDPAVKAVIRRRIDCRLDQAGGFALAAGWAPRPGRDSHDTGGD